MSDLAKENKTGQFYLLWPMPSLSVLPICTHAFVPTHAAHPQKLRKTSRACFTLSGYANGVSRSTFHFLVQRVQTSVRGRKKRVPPLRGRIQIEMVHPCLSTLFLRLRVPHRQHHRLRPEYFAVSAHWNYDYDDLCTTETTGLQTPTTFFHPHSQLSYPTLLPTLRPPQKQRSPPSRLDLRHLCQLYFYRTHPSWLDMRSCQDRQIMALLQEPREERKDLWKEQGGGYRGKG